MFIFNYTLYNGSSHGEKYFKKRQKIKPTYSHMLCIFSFEVCLEYLSIYVGSILPKSTLPWE